MSRRPSRFRERDVVRAVRAARRAQLEIAAVEITAEGAIRIIPGTPESVQPQQRNPFDD